MELPVEPDVRHAGAGSVSMNLPPSGPDLVTVPLTSPTSPDEELEAKVTKLLAGVEAGKSEAEVAGNLGVPLGQARKLLRRLVDGGVLERLPRPVRYRHAASQTSLFGGRDHAI